MADAEDLVHVFYGLMIIVLLLGFTGLIVGGCTMMWAAIL